MYLRLRGRKYQKAEEECMMMSLLIGAVHEGGQMERSKTAGCMESKVQGGCVSNSEGRRRRGCSGCRQLVVLTGRK